MSGLVAKNLGDPPPPILVCFTRPSDESFILQDQTLILSRGPKWTVFAPFIPSPDRIDGDVLILDDFVRAGDFMANARSLLADHGLEEVRTVTEAVVVSSVAKSANRQPDLYWRDSPGAEFSFPWGPAM